MTNTPERLRRRPERIIDLRTPVRLAPCIGPIVVSVDLNLASQETVREWATR